MNLLPAVVLSLSVNRKEGRTLDSAGDHFRACKEGLYNLLFEYNGSVHEKRSLHSIIVLLLLFSVQISQRFIILTRSFVGSFIQERNGRRGEFLCQNSYHLSFANIKLEGHHSWPDCSGTV